MSIKNKLAPVYFQYDILDTEMPEVFFDKSAKTHMFFYELNNTTGEIDLDNLFIDENSKTQQQFSMKFYGKIDVWITNNFSKFIQPFHSDSLAKTLAYQTELRMFVLDKPILEKIKKNFCILTFEPLDRTSSKGISIYIIKELNEFKDRQKVRHAEFKVLQLNSNLIKSSQNWNFIVEESLRRKIKQVRVSVPFYSFLGQVTLKGKKDNWPTTKEEILDYKISRIEHPFIKLEPMLVNFVENDNKLLIQLPCWDRLGKAFEWMNSVSWFNGAYNYGPSKSDNTIEASAGVAGYSYWIGTCDGIADFYCSGENQDKSSDQAYKIDNSIKAYMWTTTNINAHIAIWNSFHLGKTMRFMTFDMICNFIKNANPTYDYDWKGGYGGHKVGQRFSTYQLNILNESNFSLNNSKLDIDEITNPVWCLAGSIEFQHVFYLWRYSSGKDTYTKLFRDNMRLPFGLMDKDTIKKKMAMCKDWKTFENIEITFNLGDDGAFLNEISLILLYGENIKITFYDEIGLMSTYNYYSSFYQYGEKEIKTTLRFN